MVFCVVALSSFNIVVIRNNQVTLQAASLSLPCQVAVMPRCMDFLSSQSQWIMFLYIGYLIMLCPFPFLHNWILPICFYCPICFLVILLLIFFLFILVIVNVHVHYHVSFTGYYNVHIIIHIGNCPLKEILV
ncbi:hypothetical protein AMTRI_Chr11g96250 [Amborella trichopoda]